MARQTSFQIFDRSPLIPSLGPALEMSWQLKPAEILSTWPASCVKSYVVMSPMFGTSGQWCASTREAAGSLSAT
jgi:hypothetical protein